MPQAATLKACDRSSLFRSGPAALGSASVETTGRRDEGTWTDRTGREVTDTVGRDSWADKAAVCPFYRKICAERAEIVCEAVTGEASVTALRFVGAATMRRYVERVCCDREECRRCPIYRAAWQKYEE